MKQKINRSSLQSRLLDLNRIMKEILHVTFLLILISFVNHCDCNNLNNRNSKFLSVSTHMTASENDTVILPCAYSGKLYSEIQTGPFYSI